MYYVVRVTRTFSYWIRLARPPFHLVGIFPFVLGAVLAYHVAGTFNPGILVFGLLAVVAIMLATYYAGEYYDFEGDKLSGQMERNRFSGGTQTLVEGLLSKKPVLLGAYISLGVAAACGLILQFAFRTGVLTIPLGAVGMFAGFFYSTPPVRWVKRGVGEILIGICYGWLPIAVAFYLQTGTLNEMIFWMAVPVGLTIFNVILINEFPDHPADTLVEKRNLVVRFGREKAAWIYVSASAISWLFFVMSVLRGLPSIAWILYLPVLAISLYITLLVAVRAYRKAATLERICALTIVVNLGTSLAYILCLTKGLI